VIKVIDGLGMCRFRWQSLRFNLLDNLLVKLASKLFILKLSFVFWLISCNHLNAPIHLLKQLWLSRTAHSYLGSSTRNSCLFFSGCWSSLYARASLRSSLNRLTFELALVGVTLKNYVKTVKLGPNLKLDRHLNQFTDQTGRIRLFLRGRYAKVKTRALSWHNLW